MKRRNFVTGTAAVAAGAVSGGLGLAAPQKQPARRSILNFNERMEYRRLGKTGLMLSAVCLGGHWKRVATMLPGIKNAAGYTKEDRENINNPEFLNNRHTVLTRCMESGINYVDACSPEEILAYSRVVKGRRDKIYFGFSWHTREPRYPEWRSGKKLIEGLDLSMKEAGLDYVDLWRISLPMNSISDLGELLRVEEATVEALERARQQGKARHTGVSSHNRTWLNSIVQQYPKQIEVVLFPYTANSKELPDESIFDSVKNHDTGVLGIKPFADNSLFAGDSSPRSPHAEEDDRRARLAIRYILGNPAITAPLAGLVSIHQVDNAAKAVSERRTLDLKEKAELEEAGKRMWANLRPGYEWLKNWEYL
jgi:aryl-alcohol dehydrogenase-like predicted oxidoreductase